MALAGERMERNHKTGFIRALLTAMGGIDGFWLKRKNIRLIDTGYNSAPHRVFTKEARRKQRTAEKNYYELKLCESPCFLCLCGFILNLKF
jgi:hypothetical protein